MKSALALALLTVALPASAQQSIAVVSGGGHSSITMTVPFGQAMRLNRSSMTPIEIVEDSRCPRFVTCVWRGRLRVKFALPGGRQLVLDDGKPAPFEHGTLTMVGATPISARGEKPPPKAYRFTLRYDRR